MLRQIFVRALVVTFIGFQLVGCSSNTPDSAKISLAPTSLTSAPATPTFSAATAATAAMQSRMFYVLDNALYTLAGNETTGQLLVPSFLDMSGPELSPIRHLIGFPPSVSSNGRYAVLVGSEATWAVDVTTLYTYSIAAGKVVFSLSPNGERGTFVNSTGVQVLEMGRENKPKQIVHDTGFDPILIAWSPAGRYIAFVKRLEGSLARVLLFDWNDETVHELGQITIPAIEIAPQNISWSEDGSEVKVLNQVFAVDPGKTPVLTATPLVTATAQAPATLADFRTYMRVVPMGFTHDLGTFWSIENGRGQSEIYSQLSTNSEAQKIADVPLVSMSMGLKATEKELVVSGYHPESGKYQMMTVSIKTGQLKPLFENAMLITVINKR